MTMNKEQLTQSDNIQTSADGIGNTGYHSKNSTNQEQGFLDNDGDDYTYRRKFCSEWKI